MDYTQSNLFSYFVLMNNCIINFTLINGVPRMYSVFNIAQNENFLLIRQGFFFKWYGCEK